ncbi:MAG: phage scaffolding protein [Aminipila sp.]
MKREQIETLLKEAGVGEDKLKTTLDAVMDENGKDIEAEKAKTTAKDGELVKANDTIKGLQDDIKKFDGVDVEKLKQSAQDWETKYNTDITAEQTKAKNLERTYSLKEALRSAGVLDPDYIIFKHGGTEKFAFNDEGKLIGLDETIKPYKESNPSLFKQEDDGNGGSSFRADSGGSHGNGGNHEPTTLKAALADAYK